MRGRLEFCFPGCPVKFRGQEPYWQAGGGMGGGREEVEGRTRRGWGYTGSVQTLIDG